jgi:eukaryotic-like serine/threonine-protein kinase
VTSSQAPSLTPTNFPAFTFTPTPSPTITPTAPATPVTGAKQIAFVSNRTGAMELWIENLDGSGVTQITNIPEGACQPNWAPDSIRLIFVSPCTMNRLSYAGASLFIINADGTGLMPLPSAPGGDYDPVWSPDGSEIAFTSLREAGTPRVYIMEMSDYSVRALIAGESGSNSQPAWAPDGKMIAYVSNDNRIWAIGVNGQDDHALTVGGGDYVSQDPAWSPDGSAVIFTWTATNDTTGTTKLMAVPYTEEGALPVVVPNSLLVSEVSYSPDGYWLLFTSWYSGNHDISIMRANGNDRQAVSENPAYDFDPVWRPLVANQP